MTRPSPAVIAAYVAIATLTAFPRTSFAAPSGSASSMCIESNRVDDTHVIDKHTIVVRMNPGPEYVRVDLANDCSTLDKTTGFSWSTSINKLCTSDTLNVQRSQQSCIIDKIVPISADEAKGLEKGKVGK